MNVESYTESKKERIRKKKMGVSSEEFSEFATSMIAKFDRTEGLIIGNRNELSGLSAKLDGIVSKIEDVEKQVMENKSQILANKNELTNCVRDVKIAVFNEVNDIEAKRHNLLIFGVPEPDDSSTSGVSPREKDTRAAEGIIETIVGEKKAFDLRFRIGKKQDDKPRPILVKILEIKDKEDILGKVHNLKGHSEWDKVYVKQDLTRLQREHLKQLNENLSADAALRNQGLKNEDFRWVVQGRGMQRHLAKSKNVRV